MNPGPAPRPPVDRPSGERLRHQPSQLSLTPNTANLPGNMQNMQINSPITRTATSTYTGSTVSLASARQMSTSDMTPASTGGGLTILRDGWAQVKEGKALFVSSWNKRYLVLRKDTLDFHKSSDGKALYTVFLTDVTSVARAEAAGIIFEIKRNRNGRSNSPGEDDASGHRTLQVKLRDENDMYDWIDAIYMKCPGIGGVSNPTNFEHAVHVGFDPTTGNFVGLPQEWAKLLASSAITKEDYERNPQAVFEVLEFYSDITKRAEDPKQFSSLTPSPSVNPNNSKQLGYPNGLPSNGVAPPRPAPPGSQRTDSYGSVSSNRTQEPPRRPSPPEAQQQRQQMQGMATNYQPKSDDRQAYEAQKQRERAEAERRELEEYNASLPKSRPPMAQQEVGGGAIASDRFNPTRAAPAAPRQQAGAPAGSLRAQRQAPSAPSAANENRPQPSSATSSRNQSPAAHQRADQSGPGLKYQNGANVSAAPRGPANGQAQAQQPSRLPGPVAQVKPLNVATKQPTGAPSSNGVAQNAAVKAAEAALNAKPPAAERKQDVRMSTMTENEVMAKLKEAVSKEDPNQSYSKQKKIGQGASGSVYVAKVKETATSAVAQQVLQEQGSRAQVAIKQMDLAHQPRKELIVNEIMVMKDSKHKNIVNFLDAFLRNNFSELWVVMEYMEGGALTDVIDNNQNITEPQISTICLEVCFLFFLSMQWVSMLILVDLPWIGASASTEHHPP